MSFIVTNIILIIIIAFFYGFFALIGIPTVIPKLSIFFLSLFIFHYSLLTQNTKRNQFYFKYTNSFLLYLLFFFISFFINSSDILKSFSFLHYTIIGYLILLIMLNLSLTKVRIRRILKAIDIIFIIQILFSIYKFIFMGKKEAVIGTISLTSGQLNTIFPLIGIIYFLSKYFLLKKKNIYILYIIGMLFMSYVGEKRAIYFILPIILIFFFYLFNKIKFNNSIFNYKFLFYSVLVTILSIPFIYFGVKYNPTLNPENISGGSFNFDFILNYLFYYNYTPDTLLVGGRIAGLEYVINSISFDNIKSLFGYGPDFLIGYDNSFEGGGSLGRIGIRDLMSVNGLSSYILSIGFLGTLSFILFHFYIIRMVYLNSLNAYIINKQIFYFLHIFTISLFLIIFFDFFIYSNSFFHHHSTSILFFLFSGLCLNINIKNI